MLHPFSFLARNTIFMQLLLSYDRLAVMSIELDVIHPIPPFLTLHNKNLYRYLWCGYYYDFCHGLDCLWHTFVDFTTCFTWNIHPNVA